MYNIDQLRLITDKFRDQFQDWTENERQEAYTALKNCFNPELDADYIFPRNPEGKGYTSCYPKQKDLTPEQRAIAREFLKGVNIDAYLEDPQGVEMDMYEAASEIVAAAYELHARDFADNLDDDQLSDLQDELAKLKGLRR